MATASRGRRAAVMERLRQSPHSFEFFQAVRLLERRADPTRAPGQDARPSEESVRFGVRVSTSFPASSIGELDIDPSETDGPARMVVDFFGLTGPVGVMPRHFDTLLIDRVRANDPAIAHFQDLLNHRAISLFYRAWRKSRIELAFEQRRLEQGRANEDPFGLPLLCLAGFGTGVLADRCRAGAESIIRYAGVFALGEPSADAIEGLVADFTGRPARVEQFAGRWVAISREDQTVLSENGAGRNCQLGRTCVLGERVWHAGAAFRVRIGPMNLDEFVALLPGSSGFGALHDLVVALTRGQYDIELRLCLFADEAPRCVLGEPDTPARLGWTTFLLTEGLKHDFCGAVFALAESAPAR
jgi:type VI secretion system protein ImpH